MKKLYRSRTDRVIAGICGGIAAYYDIDSTIVRLVLGFFWIMTGFLPLTLAYLISILIIPLEPINEQKQTHRYFYRSRTNRMLGGICGAIAESNNMDPTVVRLITVLIAFLTGFLPLAIIYCIAWMIIPQKEIG